MLLSRPYVLRHHHDWAGGVPPHLKRFVGADDLMYCRGNLQPSKTIKAIKNNQIDYCAATFSTKPVRNLAEICEISIICACSQENYKGTCLKYKPTIDCPHRQPWRAAACLIATMPARRGRTKKDHS
jgi:hypothetical protein